MRRPFNRVMRRFAAVDLSAYVIIRPLVLREQPPVSSDSSPVRTSLGDDRLNQSDPRITTGGPGVPKRWWRRRNRLILDRKIAKQAVSAPQLDGIRRWRAPKLPPRINHTNVSEDTQTLIGLEAAGVELTRV